MIRMFMRGAVLLAAVTAVGLLGAGGAVAAPGDAPSIDVAGVAAYFGVSTGTGADFSPGGAADVYVYDADTAGTPVIGWIRVTATQPYFHCDRFVCAHYPGGEISWSLTIGTGTCSHNLWIHVVDLSTAKGSNWIFAVHYCYVHGG